ncbi:MAG: transposase [Acidiferrobacteraceae bacterium]
MGEAKRRTQTAMSAITQAVGVEAPNGRLHVRWDGESAATPFGQMAFFLEFLHLTGLYERWQTGCPLSYSGPHGSRREDILGTWFLSLLAGHRRYAHMNAIRFDGVMPELLGMDRVVAEDTVRRFLKAIDEPPGMDWLQTHLDACVQPLCSAPWILDVDVTVKPLYGHQEGALLGYNPKKPGRPAHTYHTYQMAGLRLVLGVDVEPGNQSHSNTTLPGLLKLIDRLPSSQRPYCVRGDAGFGNDAVMTGLEARQIPYLLKLRATKNVKRFVEKVFWSQGWRDAGEGFEGREGELALSGWQKPRRIVVLRRRLKGEVVLSDEAHQLALGFVESEVATHRYEYFVLVTDLTQEIRTLAQLYRDRADSENTFDELKNQWAWGGFTTQDLKRCRFNAMAVALIYNWWSLFVRLANPKARLEAITSRPFLLSSVARKTRHGGQQHLVITPSHRYAHLAQAMLTRVSRMLQAWAKTTAEQLNPTAVWARVCEHLMTTLTGVNWLKPPPNRLAGAG